MAGFAKLNPLIEDGSYKEFTDKHVDEVLSNLAKRLAPGRDEGRFNIDILDGDRRRSYSVQLKDRNCSVATQAVGKADFEIVLSKETFVEVATGNLSPVDAFLTGRMEVRGDLNFGKRLFARTAARHGVQEIG